MAIVPYSRRTFYPAPSVWLTDGYGNNLQVQGPAGLRDWANCQNPPKTWACWDLASWLPVDPRRAHGGRITGLDGKRCWESVWAGEFFGQLMRALANCRCDLVLPETQLLVEHSAGAEPPSDQSSTAQVGAKPRVRAASCNFGLGCTAPAASTGRRPWR